MVKPFVARGSRVDRCPSCLLAKRVCICAYKVERQAEASFSLMMHHNETFKPTNTGRLIADCFGDTQYFKWSRTEPDQAFLQMINDQVVDPYIVFPEGEGYEARMTEYQPKEGKRPMFILLDGTWRQARRMFRHSRYMDQLPVIQPKVQSSSRYRLRKAAVEGQLATAEVAAAMLEQIGDNQSARHLLSYFSVFNEHYRAARLTRPLIDDTEEKLFLNQLSSQNVTGPSLTSETCISAANCPVATL